jgi:hypothetical protein
MAFQRSTLLAILQNDIREDLSVFPPQTNQQSKTDLKETMKAANPKETLEQSKLRTKKFCEKRRLPREVSQIS